ncbi:hypothetical protein V2G26_012198 [Clonostachys chloroleuca]
MDSCPQLTKKLQSFLTTEWTRKNTPRGLAAAWKGAQAHTSNETPKVFSEHGFKPFLAYHLGTIESTSHKKGDKSGDKLRQDLDNLPLDVLRKIAIELRDTQSHPTVDEAIGKMANAAKRRRLQTTDDSEESSPTPPERLTTLPTDDRQTETSGTLDTPHTSTSRTTELRVTSVQLTTLAVPSKEQRFTNASPHGIAQVFPPYMCGAVRKIGSGEDIRAAVTMDFPYQQFGGIHCLMSLSIVPSRLAIIAKELFCKTLDIDSGMQYIVDERGGKCCLCHL